MVFFSGVVGFLTGAVVGFFVGAGVGFFVGAGVGAGVGFGVAVLSLIIGLTLPVFASVSFNLAIFLSVSFNFLASLVDALSFFNCPILLPMTFFACRAGSFFTGLGLGLVGSKSSGFFGGVGSNAGLGADGGNEGPTDDATADPDEVIPPVAKI